MARRPGNGEALRVRDASLERSATYIIAPTELKNQGEAIAAERDDGNI